MFGPCLQPAGAELVREDIRTDGILKPDLWDKLILEVKDVQAEKATGKGVETLARLWKQSPPEDVIKDPDMDGFNGDDSILSLLLTYLPPELADQLRANLPQINARHARMIRDSPMQAEVWGESSSQSVDGESQDDSWLAVHFLPEPERQPILDLHRPISNKVDVSRTISASEETLVAGSIVVSGPHSEADTSAAIPSPHPVLDDALPISSPQNRYSAPSRQPPVKNDQGRTPLPMKRPRDPEPPDVPLKRRKPSPAREEDSSSPAASASFKSSSISQKQPRQFRKPSSSTSSSPSVYISPKLERKAWHLGFKGEAEIQNLAAMRERLKSMTSKPVEGGDKSNPTPDKPDMGSPCSPPKKVRHGLRNPEGDPGHALKQEVIQGIKDGRSAARLRCIGSQSQRP